MANMLAELSELAHESSSEKRRDLLSRVATLFSAAEQEASQSEAALFQDIIDQIFVQIEHHHRVQFSSSVAKDDNLPRSLAMKMAQDDAAVAWPILQHSSVLNDDDLIHVARTQTIQHREIMAGRPAISEQVTDVLIDHGEETVMARVAGNKTAQVSSQGFARLGESAKTSKKVLNALAERSDVPPVIAEKIIPILPEDKQRHFLMVLETMPEIGAVVTDVFEKAKAEEQNNRLEARVLLQKIMNQQLQASKVLSVLAMEDRVLDIAKIMAALALYPETKIMRLLLQIKDEPVSILCAAAGLSYKAYQDIAAMRWRKLRMPPRPGADEASYAKLDSESARRAVRFLKVSGA